MTQTDAVACCREAQREKEALLPCRRSGDTDGIRASEVEHAVGASTARQPPRTNVPRRSDQPNVRGCVSVNRCLKSVDRCNLKKYNCDKSHRWQINKTRKSNMDKTPFCKEVIWHN